MIEFGRPVGEPSNIVSNFLKPVRQVLCGNQKEYHCSSLTLARDSKYDRHLKFVVEMKESDQESHLGCAQFKRV